MSQMRVDQRKSVNMWSNNNSANNTFWACFRNVVVFILLANTHTHTKHLMCVHARKCTPNAENFPFEKVLHSHISDLVWLRSDSEWIEKRLEAAAVRARRSIYRPVHQNCPAAPLKGRDRQEKQTNTHIFFISILIWYILVVCHFHQNFHKYIQSVPLIHFVSNLLYFHEFIWFWWVCVCACVRVHTLLVLQIVVFSLHLPWFLRRITNFDCFTEQITKLFLQYHLQ